LVIQTIRNYLNTRKFVEVETPGIQAIYGGAAAKPFKTHLNALKMDAFLRISPELYLKRLIVGGFERVYEIGKNFRNEDIDRSHNPEFTMLELYQAYADFNVMKEITMDLYIEACKAVNGSSVADYDGKKINFKKPWQEYTMVDSIKKFASIDVEKLSDKELSALMKDVKVKVPVKPSRGEMIQALFEDKVEHELIQPTFITHHPIESTPLCKQCRIHPDKWVERFEPFAMGMELANAYSELNDPQRQRMLLEDHAKQLKKGAEEASPMDEDFVQAIEFGMPPTGGLGIGIDRMVMLLTGQTSIRDVILFPFMKSEK